MRIGRRSGLDDFWLAVRKGIAFLLSGKALRDPRSLGRVFRKGRWLMMRHLRVEEVVLPFLRDMRLCVKTSDNIIACDVYLDGHFGYEQFAAAMDHLSSRSYFGGDHVVFMDVGANVGTHTLYAFHSAKFFRVISIEPERGNFELLVRNLLINGYARTDARNVALSNRSGEALMLMSADNLGDHRIARMPAGISTDCNEDSCQSVPLVDFDTLAKELQLESSDRLLFWIDTQGHEFEVLSGIGSHLLGANAFVVEFWPSLLESNGTLEEFIGIASTAADRYLVLQEPQTLREIAELGRLSGHLLHQKHPADQVDILFLGRHSAIRR